MTMTSQNFFTQNDPKAVKTAEGAQVTEGASPVVNKAEHINPGAQPNTNNTFGKGVSSPGSRVYNDSNRQ